uniref:Uncharacterized protein n=1 Tax=Mycena chlorophos TaxID=658473 RepID=A0ABQ0M0B0_MYCCL|nr:predicted protein [Mycena chlorophos]
MAGWCQLRKARGMLGGNADGGFQGLQWKSAQVLVCFHFRPASTSLSTPMRCAAAGFHGPRSMPREAEGRRRGVLFRSAEDSVSVSFLLMATEPARRPRIFASPCHCPTQGTVPRVRFTSSLGSPFFSQAVVVNAGAGAGAEGLAREGAKEAWRECGKGEAEVNAASFCDTGRCRAIALSFTPPAHRPLSSTR